MQQPGLQQLPTGWPGMPGLQAPPQSQAQVPPVQSFPLQPFQIQQFQAPPAQGQVPPQSAQAAPVAPVAFPGSTAPNAAQPVAQGGQANPAQAFARQLIEAARLLEQAIPGYQIGIATLLDLASASLTTRPPGVDEAIAGLKEATYYHGAALGAIRRLLFGEMTPAVLSLLATSYHLLAETQAQLRPALDRVLMSAPLTARPNLTGLGQSLTTGDTALAQAGAALQAIVGPQVWDSGRSRARGLRGGSEWAGGN